MFEYLVEHGATFTSDEEMNESAIAMLQRRRDWIHQAAAIARRWYVPLTAIRMIHEYVVGFNWPVVCEALAQNAKPN